MNLFNKFVLLFFIYPQIARRCIWGVFALSLLIVRAIGIVIAHSWITALDGNY